MAGRAATVIDTRGEARRTSAIAGSAMTASPSQFGERMTRRFIVWYGRMTVTNERTTIDAHVGRTPALPDRS